MGVTTKAITFVGKEFRNEAEGLVYMNYPPLKIELVVGVS